MPTHPHVIVRNGCGHTDPSTRERDSLADVLPLLRAQEAVTAAEAALKTGGPEELAAALKKVQDALKNLKGPETKCMRAKLQAEVQKLQAAIAAGGSQFTGTATNYSAVNGAPAPVSPSAEEGTPLRRLFTLFLP